MTQVKDKRQLAMIWWNALSYHDKCNLTNIYYYEHLRTPQSLTGREIEFIWGKEASTPVLVEGKHYSADDNCPVCDTVKNENGECLCKESWGGKESGTVEHPVSYARNMAQKQMGSKSEGKEVKEESYTIADVEKAFKHCYQTGKVHPGNNMNKDWEAYKKTLSTTTL